MADQDTEVWAEAESDVGRKRIRTSKIAASRMNAQLEAHVLKVIAIVPGDQSVSVSLIK